ncbi:hypothetical protein BGX27_008869 [Mortierella sp. AM989]|nr:hypothetical protein BGX27_008869 [Mortierella sp. AM989]
MDEITRTLEPYNFARCALVSKQWNAWFTPWVWRTVRYCKDIDKVKLEYHKGYIRSIQELGSMNQFWEIIPCNLQTVEFKSQRKQRGYDLKLAHFLSTVPTLQNLVIHAFGTLFYQDLIKAVEDHPGLRNLTLQCRRFGSPSSFVRFIQACRNFQTLRLSTNDSECKFALEDQTSSVEHVWLHCKDIHIQHLSINIDLSLFEADILIPLLERTFALKTLELQHIHSSETMRQVEHILKDEKRPRLEYLRIGGVIVDTKFTPSTYGFCGSRDSIVSPGGVKGPETAFKLEGSPSMSDPFFRDLPLYFKDAITVFYALSNRISIHSLAILLSQLPNLRSATIDLESKIGFEVDGVTLESVFSTPWICLDLKILVMYFDYARPPEDGGYLIWESYVGPRCLEYIFSQIGRLTQLQDWSIHTRVSVLSLRTGYLHLLSGLKQLRLLDLSSYANGSDISLEEAKWMLKNWEKLETLLVKSATDGRNAKLRKNIKKNVLDEIKRLRPELRIQ